MPPALTLVRVEAVEANPKERHVDARGDEAEHLPKLLAELGTLERALLGRALELGAKRVEHRLQRLDAIDDARHVRVVEERRRRRRRARREESRDGPGREPATAVAREQRLTAGETHPVDVARALGEPVLDGVRHPAAAAIVAPPVARPFADGRRTKVRAVRRGIAEAVHQRELAGLERRAERPERRVQPVRVVEREELLSAERERRSRGAVALVAPRHERVETVVGPGELDQDEPRTARRRRGRARERGGHALDGTRLAGRRPVLRRPSRHAGVIDSAASIVDGTRAVVYVWYDNEFGYSRQVVRCLEELAGIVMPNFPKRNVG